VTRPTVAEVSLSAVRENLRALVRLVGPGVKVLGVVKADAYGHGAARVARALQEDGVDQLGVALVGEGVALREAGIRTPILVMGPTFEDEWPDLFRHDLVPTVDDLGSARALDRYVAKAAVRHAGYHLKVDTGMNRLGLRGEEVVEQAGELASLERLAMQAVYTHFACADQAGHPTLAAQLARFEGAIESLAAQGVRPPLVHAANSAAAVTLPAARFGMVRPGLALYGVSPCPEARPLALRPALALKSRIVRVKRVPKGEGVSYGHTWQAPRDSVIGILPIGYGDGYPRSLSNKGCVRVAGRLCPIVGVVCMDATMVDLTELGTRNSELGINGTAGRRALGTGTTENRPIRHPPSAIPNLVGLEAALIEADNDSPLSAAAVARQAGTIPYEVLSVLTRRVPRVYV
jgi:alanine racemase